MGFMAYSPLGPRFFRRPPCTARAISARAGTVTHAFNRQSRTEPAIAVEVEAVAREKALHRRSLTLALADGAGKRHHPIPSNKNTQSLEEEYFKAADISKQRDLERLK